MPLNNLKPSGRTSISSTILLSAVCLLPTPVSSSHTPMSHSVQDSLPLTKHTIYTVQPFVLSNVFEFGFTFCWQAESSYFSCENAAFKGTLTGFICDILNAYAVQLIPLLHKKSVIYSLYFLLISPYIHIYKCITFHLNNHVFIWHGMWSDSVGFCLSWNINCVCNSMPYFNYQHPLHSISASLFSHGDRFACESAAAPQDKFQYWNTISLFPLLYTYSWFVCYTSLKCLNALVLGF